MSQNSNGADNSTCANDQPQADALELDNYRACARAITPSDRKLLHELTVSVFWPHRDHDLDLFLSLGQGYLALDEIERPMGSAMGFAMGEAFTMIGMMVTHPRLQTQGTGRWLLERVMADCQGHDLRLSATRAGYWLYESVGFRPVTRIWQHQGLARPIHAPDPVPGVTTRPLDEADRAAILALDTPAFGADRSHVIDALLDLSSGYVAVRDGEVVAYAMVRHFGRGKVIGPVVAENAQIAMQIVAPIVQANAGGFLRLDLPLEDPEFAAFLSASGLGVFDTVTEMCLGTQRRATRGPRLFALSAHSLG